MGTAHLHCVRRNPLRRSLMATRSNRTDKACSNRRHDDTRLFKFKSPIFIIVTQSDYIIVIILSVRTTAVANNYIANFMRQCDK